MANVLYYFNPDHDMAMANFTPYYKSPAGIARMAADLSVLPAWYADSETSVKVDYLSRGDALEKLCKESGVFPAVRWTDRWESCMYRPWGWNPALLYRLRQENVDEAFLLTDEQMRRIRFLSGRQCAAKVLRAFECFPFVCGSAEECHTIDDVKTYIRNCGNSMLKSPWSGSGRGLNRVSSDTWNVQLEGWISRILRTQGSVMAEPLYEKVLDFAMEFYAAGNGRVLFVGYSVFETDFHGNYKANILASDEHLENYLSRYVSVKELHAIRKVLNNELENLLRTDYAGYLGVDMMICRYENCLRVHPCVEINLRMNMGVVSHLISERYLSAGVEGHYVVEYYTKDGEAWISHRQKQMSNPIEVEGGRVCKGYMSLTPVEKDTRYQVYIMI